MSPSVNDTFQHIPGHEPYDELEAILTSTRAKFRTKFTQCGIYKLRADVRRQSAESVFHHLMYIKW